MLHAPESWLLPASELLLCDLVACARELGTADASCSSLCAAIAAREQRAAAVGAARAQLEADLGAMEHLLRSFHDTWRPGVESINRDVMKSFADLKLGMDILKQVLTQLLLYYTRFLDLVKQAYPNGAPFAQFIVSIPTLMKEIKNFSRSV